MGRLRQYDVEEYPEYGLCEMCTRSPRGNGSLSLVQDIGELWCECCIFNGHNIGDVELCKPAEHCEACSLVYTQDGIAYRNEEDGTVVCLDCFGVVPNNLDGMSKRIAELSSLLYLSRQRSQAAIREAHPHVLRQQNGSEHQQHKDNALGWLKRWVYPKDKQDVIQS